VQENFKMIIVNTSYNHNRIHLFYYTLSEKNLFFGLGLLWPMAALAKFVC